MNEPVISYITCCQTTNVDLECLTVWSGARIDSFTNVTCPSADYFMTSCSGFDAFSTVNAWEVIDDDIDNTNDYCRVRYGYAVKNLNNMYMYIIILVRF